MPKLHDLLAKSEKDVKVLIAYAIYQACQDDKMIDIVLDETPKLKGWYQLHDVLFLLIDFEDERVVKMLTEFKKHEDKEIANHAKQAIFSLPERSLTIHNVNYCLN